MYKNVNDAWDQVLRVGEVDRLDDSAMLCLGNAFGYITHKTIDRLVEKAHNTAVEKGFHDEDKDNPTYLALIHSEVSEALEADRKGDEENFAEELADICIRVFDLAGLRGIDLQKEIVDKMEKNEKRPRKHGKRY